MTHPSTHMNCNLDKEKHTGNGFKSSTSLGQDSVRAGKFETRRSKNVPEHLGKMSWDDNFGKPCCSANAVLAI